MFPMDRRRACHGPTIVGQHNEHRIPLPKASSLVLSRLTHCDYRAGMVLNVISLGAMAFAMIRVAKRLRGSIVLYRCLLSPALLQLGQIDNLLCGFQVAFVMGSILASILLLIIVRHPTRLGLRSLSWREPAFSCYRSVEGTVWPGAIPCLVAWFRRNPSPGLR